MNQNEVMQKYIIYTYTLICDYVATAAQLSTENPPQSILCAHVSV